MIRAARKEELKQQIFKTAMRLFQEKGFDQVTVEDITQSCGIAKGTFYNYFPRKEAVLLHLDQAQMRVVYEAVQSTAEVTELKERLRILFHELFVRFGDSSELTRLIIMEMMRSALVLKEEMTIITQLQAVLSDLIAYGQRERQASPSIDAGAAAEVLVGHYFQSIMKWAAGSGSEPLEAIFENGFEVIWQGMRMQEDTP